MEASKKRVGRPKAHPRTRPLVLEEDPDRVRIEIEIAGSTAGDLQEYVRWVELSSALTTADAISKTVDFALRSVFQRDRLWQEHRRGGARSGATTTTATPRSSPPPASPVSGASPPLPPPAGIAARTAKDVGI